MNTLEYSNLHLHLLGTLHVTQMVQQLVPDNLTLSHDYLACHWELDMVQVVVNL